MAQAGFICAAGRCIGMSHKRAWQLVGSLNRDFAAPLVSASRGGAQGAGATLAPLGLEVHMYPSLQSRATTMPQDGLDRLAEKLAPRPGALP